MPDIALGALIGIAGTIVGAVITGVVAFVNAKSQLDLRTYELRTDRMIKAREQVLVPLREAVSRSLELANTAMVMTIRMGGSRDRNEDSEQIGKAIRLWKEASEKSTEADARLEMLRGQVSDAELYRMIEEVRSAERRERPGIIEALDRVQKRENWNIEAVMQINTEIEEARARIFAKSLLVNGRIEELLSGK